jgi:hypothetical protein
VSRLAAPATQGREASPIALVIILVLLVAVVLLIRSMNRHLRKIPPTFTDRDMHGNPVRGTDTGAPPAPDAGTDPGDAARS